MDETLRPCYKARKSRICKKVKNAISFYTKYWRGFFMFVEKSSAAGFFTANGDKNKKRQLLASIIHNSHLSVNFIAF
ncbi:hypothetical protein [Heyndrickxia coagulans]|uniref:hypothetical protein n=1 Tax=Heyndrickxia coagulans TaxID=1398 RepID=UPI0022357996|nr:hypothetical protein [Heyndrickxia coagulans]UZH06224.1 hypothetical protein ONG97_15630 [Heyndrickxia coagulans]